MSEALEDRKLVKIERHYQRIFSHLDPTLLTEESPLSWPAEDEPDTAHEFHHADHFLGFYSQRGMEIVFDRYGLRSKLAQRGFSDISISLARHKDGYDILRVRTARSRHPLMELVACIGGLSPEASGVEGIGHRRFLNVKWLRMQNPLAKPADGRPLLPGQAFPGLGLGREMMALLQMICVRLDLDGVFELPERLHNAALYFRRFRFLDPDYQGVLTAILRDTRERTLLELAWGVEYGGLTDLRARKTFRWIPREQMLARTGPVLAFLDSEGYRRRATEAMERCRYQLSSGDLAMDLATIGSEGPIGEDPIPSRIK